MKRDWKRKLYKVNNDESGYVLIMSLFVLFIVVLIGTALAVVGIQEYNLSARTKLMDEAYSIAEAGVNRAAVQIKLDPSLTSISTDGTHDYGVLDATPQWEIAAPGESFGDGSFTTQIWQSELSGAANMKVIVATGTITRGDRTAERTIETRLAAGSGGDYDASFDYCIYNGMADSRETVWPSPDEDAFLAGFFILDGVTPYPETNPHYPKGALYTRGSIDFTTQVAEGVKIKGNMVAEDDIYLRNIFGTEATGSGLELTDGNVVAGADGSGSIELELTSLMSLNGYIDAISVAGNLCAADDVTIESLTGWQVWGNDAMSIGGIIAGGNVMVTSNTASNFLDGGGITIGDIYAGGSTVIDTCTDAGVTCGQINSGRDDTGLGVQINTTKSELSGGSIFTSGKCELITEGSGCVIGVGNIYAGTNSPDYIGGEGVLFEPTFAEVSTGNIWSRGRVDISNVNFSASVSDIIAGTDDESGSGGIGINIAAAGFNVGLGGTITAQGTIDISAIGILGSKTGNIWSGNDVILDITGLFSNNIGNISSVGNTNIELKAAISGLNIGRCKTNGDYYCHIIGAFAGLSIQGIASGGDVYVKNEASLLSVCYSNIYSLSGEDATLWSDTPANDSVWAGGNIYLESVGLLAAHWLDTNYNMKYVTTCTRNSSTYVYWETNTQYAAGTTIGDALASYEPVDEPGLPGVFSGDKVLWVDSDDDGLQDGMTAPPAEVENLDSLEMTPPTIGQRELLALVDLGAMVELISPNWTYFEQCATEDNVSGVQHILTDDDGDGIVEFVWDADSDYSSKETVFCGATWVNGSGETVYSDLYINKLDWEDMSAETGAVFEGTVVCKGNVYINCPNSTDWYLASGDTLNIVAGGNIEVTNSGMTLLKEAESHFHFWAVDDILFQNDDFALLGIDTFYGSFTAGNRVIYESDTFWQNVTFKWSRWALDPVAWLPPFKIYTWKEI